MQFQYFDRMWRDYSSAHNAQLQQLLATPSAVVNLSIGSTTYAVSLVTFHQCNLRTGYKRPIRVVDASGNVVLASPASSTPHGPSHGGSKKRSRVTAVSTETLVCSTDPALSDSKLSEEEVVALAQLQPVPADDPCLKDTCCLCLEDLRPSTTPSTDAPASDDPGMVPAQPKACSGHAFHRACIIETIQHRPLCPICSYRFAPEVGTQPDGKMVIETFDEKDGVALPGFKGFGLIRIYYVIPSGTQTAKHPNPGTPYHGTTREAFLPNSPEGREMLAMFKRAFLARLVFTVGTSVTTGRSDCVVWNGIHHKTSRSGGAFGYPDASYLDRVKLELAAKGIKPLSSPTASAEPPSASTKSGGSAGAGAGSGVGADAGADTGVGAGAGAGPGGDAGAA